MTPGVKYTINIKNAKLVSGSATQFSILLYDFTALKSYDRYDWNFGNNLVIKITCPASVPNSNNVGLLIYSGIVGATAGNTTQFSGINVLPSTASVITNSTVVSIDNDHTLFAKWTKTTSTTSATSAEKQTNNTINTKVDLWFEAENKH